MKRGGRGEKERGSISRLIILNDLHFILFLLLLVFNRQSITLFSLSIFCLPLLSSFYPLFIVLPFSKQYFNFSRFPVLAAVSMHSAVYSDISHLGERHKKGGGGGTVMEGLKEIQKIDWQFTPSPQFLLLFF